LTGYVASQTIDDSVHHHPAPIGILLPLPPWRRRRPDMPTLFAPQSLTLPLFRQPVLPPLTQCSPKAQNLRDLIRWCLRRRCPLLFHTVTHRSDTRLEGQKANSPTIQAPLESPLF
jgi:hypothetical protein